MTATSVRNWAGNIEFRGALHRPRSVAQLQQLVAGLPGVRALGTGHSFNRIADADALVSVADLPAVCELQDDGQVRVSAGTRYGVLARYLHERGRALHNLGSLPHISVAGACATGTHGAGARLPGLAAAVTSVDLVTADGSLRTVSAGDPAFPAAAVSLGALGVATALTLATEPTYDISQTVYEPLPLDAVEPDPWAVLGAGYSVSLFTRWEDAAVAWVKDRGPSAPAFFGASPADGPRHPIPGAAPVHSTIQAGVPGPWFERLPHFRLEFTPSAGDELQSEYVVDRAAAGAALAAIRALGGRLRPVLQVSEIRAIAADELWLSPAYGRDSVAFHFTWTPDAAAVDPVVDLLEAALAPFDARPHWGKVFHRAPGTYPRLADFRAVVEQFDPQRKFANDLLTSWLG